MNQYDGRQIVSDEAANRQYDAGDEQEHRNQRPGIPQRMTQCNENGGTRLESPASPIATRANMLRRIYEVDPLMWRSCGAEMRIISFLTDPPVVAPGLG